jgi:hypothetical protein
MKKQIFILTIALGVLMVLPASTLAQEWAINGSYTESCSCNPTCPCHFGSASTLGHCQGIGLLEIKVGHYGDVKLDGVSIVAAQDMGKWVKYYVNDGVSDEQAKAAGLIFAEMMEGYPPEMKVLSTQIVPIEVERTATRIKFSVPDSKVEIEVMKGLNDKPIKIANLPAARLKDYTQYKSIILDHKGEQKFSYSGTNGLTSKVDMSSN